MVLRPVSSKQSALSNTNEYQYIGEYVLVHTHSQTKGGSGMRLIVYRQRMSRMRPQSIASKRSQNSLYLCILIPRLKNGQK